MRCAHARPYKIIAVTGGIKRYDNTIRTGTIVHKKPPPLFSNRGEGVHDLLYSYSKPQASILRALRARIEAREYSFQNPRRGRGVGWGFGDGVFLTIVPAFQQASGCPVSIRSLGFFLNYPKWYPKRRGETSHIKNLRRLKKESIVPKLDMPLYYMKR